MAVPITNLEAQQAIDIEVERHKGIIRGLLKRRNTYATISKLPVEIMAQIFRLCPTLANEDLERTRTTLINIMGVCTAWRDIALNVPQLWSFVSLARPGWIARSLQRSKNTPLSVKLNRNHRLDLLEKVVGETYRFKELEINWPQEEMASLVSSFFLTDPSPHAPSLRKLGIEIQPSRHTTERQANVMQPFWSDLIGLQYLRLLHVYPSKISFLPSLTYIHIYTHGGNGLSASWVIDLLRNAPMLEDISIGIISSTSPLPPILPSPLTLSNVRNIRLHMEYLRESYLLSSLEFPATVEALSIEFEGDGGRAQSVEELSPLQKLISHFFAGHSHTPLNVIINEHKLYYKLSVENHPAGDFFQLVIAPWILRDINLAASLPLGSIHHLTLHTQGSNALAWSNLLPLLTHLRSVNVDNVTVFNSLAGPTPTSPRTTIAEFNNLDLERVSIDGDKTSKHQDWSFFACICRARHKHGKPVQKLEIRDSHIPKKGVRGIECTVVHWDGYGAANKN